MPKLVIYAHEKQSLQKARDIARILAVHQKHLPVSRQAAATLTDLCKLVDGAALPDPVADEDGER